eukprot:Nk52_evm4s158 gene=Nk52_evmTU4s158
MDSNKVAPQPPVALEPGNVDSAVNEQGEVKNIQVPEIPEENLIKIQGPEGSNQSLERRKYGAPKATTQNTLGVNSARYNRLINVTQSKRKRRKKGNRLSITGGSFDGSGSFLTASSAGTFSESVSVRSGVGASDARSWEEGDRASVTLTEVNMNEEEEEEDEDVYEIPTYFRRYRQEDGSMLEKEGIGGEEISTVPLPRVLEYINLLLQLFSMVPCESRTSLKYVVSKFIYLIVASDALFMLYVLYDVSSEGILNPTFFISVFIWGFYLFTLQTEAIFRTHDDWFLRLIMLFVLDEKDAKVATRAGWYCVAIFFIVTAVDSILICFGTFGTIEEARVQFSSFSGPFANSTGFKVVYAVAFIFLSMVWATAVATFLVLIQTLTHRGDRIISLLLSEAHFKDIPSIIQEYLDVHWCSMALNVRFQFPLFLSVAFHSGNSVIIIYTLIFQSSGFTWITYTSFFIWLTFLILFWVLYCVLTAAHNAHSNKLLNLLCHLQADDISTKAQIVTALERLEGISAGVRMFGGILITWEWIVSALGIVISVMLLLLQLESQ